ncbi:hypothetical protein F2Q69_00002810 [Brassica cretica]|uniref:Uncharacterized protein n=1 Tax=Brassica cretica TaxID=69181 RepID=A0A8S9P3C3_BRACR|nr:hypothetical protein F2Q69_00002810 [Brassica cretica]
MSEDSDEARFCEDRTSTSSSQPESRPTCPVLPYRYQRPLTFQVQGKAMLTDNGDHGENATARIIQRLSITTNTTILHATESDLYPFQQTSIEMPTYQFLR